MTYREPRLLTWISRTDPDHDALYGDLVEQLGHGRSRAWFWWQLLYAAAAFTGVKAWTAKRTIAESWALRLAMLGVLVFAGYVTVVLGVLVANLAWRTL